MRAKFFIIWLGGFLLGALIAPFFDFNNVIIYQYLSFTLIASSFILFRNKHFWATIFSFGLVFFSIFLFGIQTNTFEDLNSQYSGRSLGFLVRVADIPTETEHGFVTKAEIVQPQELENKQIVLYFDDKRDIGFGEIIRFTGKIKKFEEKKRANLIKQKVIGEVSANKVEITKNPEEFNVRGLLFKVRNKMNESLERLLPDKEAGLASGLILGEKSRITPETKRFLQASGTSHIIALSGYNITIILGLFLVMRNKFSRIINLLIPFIFVILFIVMTGASASVVRAGIMGFMPSLAKYLGRPKTPIIAILFSASIMVALNPYILLFDVGLQLSFAAMIGLTYISPVILNIFNKELTIFRIFSETLGAQIAVLPLLVFYFGQISIISPISNLLILLLVPIGMLISFIVGLFGIISPFVGQLLAIPGFIILKIFYILIEFFGSLPFALLQLKINQPIWIFILYFLIFDIIFLLKKRSARTP